ncbi:chitinase [Streptomyces sp. SID8379]|uniref:chitinase n=1 Tax=unclassified Streptomyces TaxID=2593676 RepID=UPI000366DE4E|nr:MULTISPECIES: chitinase [unclassified Streptomyces]MYW63875.1 chitinase [Streptomyces sp. SID8379]
MFGLWFTRRVVWVAAAVAGIAGVVVAPGAATASEGHGHHQGRFVVSEAQFERMFPERNAFFTYDGLVEATKAYPRFAHTGGRAAREREAAAFLANVSHETGGLYYVVAQNTSTYPIFCDEARSYGCPAGHDAYYGRGAIMLSWNFNYKAAGDALGLDLLHEPWLVERDPAVAWMTALWYWNTQTGPGTMTGHDAMVSGAGFGETIRSLNGTAECDGANGGANTAQMKHRVELYVGFSRVLRVSPGRGLTC